MSRQFAALRGVAILLVVVNHSVALSLDALRAAGQPGPAAWQVTILIIVKSWGLMAVPIFLFLSGAYIAYATKGRDLRASYRTIVMSLRFVLVPYLIWSILFYVLIFFISHDQYSLIGYLRNLVVGYPFNFVPILVFFYVIGPLLVRISERRPVLVLIIALGYQVLCADVLKPDLIGLQLPSWAYFLTIPGIRQSMAIWGIFFPVGVILSLHRNRMLTVLERAVVPIASLTVVFYAMVLVNELTTLPLAIGEWLFPLAGIFLVPLIPRDGIPLASWMEWLGKMAYGLYLTNLTVLSLSISLLSSWLPFLFQVVIILVGFLIVVTIGVNAGLFEAFGRSPAPRLRRYLFG